MDEILTTSQKSSCKKCLAKVATARANISLLKAVGVDTEQDDRRADELEAAAKLLLSTSNPSGK